MRKFFNFGKPEYQAPKVSPVPDGQSSQGSGTMINESTRQIQVIIFDGGRPEDLAIALGTLEIAKDVVKHQISAWHEKDRRLKGIISVGGNGHG